MHDVALRQRRRERRAQLPVLLIASRTLGSVRVNDHRDRGRRVRRGDKFCEMANPIGEFITEVGAHHRP